MELKVQWSHLACRSYLIPPQQPVAEKTCYSTGKCPGSGETAALVSCSDQRPRFFLDKSYWLVPGGEEPTCRLDEHNITTGNWDGTMRSSCAVGFSWLVVARNDAAAQANRSAPNRFASPPRSGACVISVNFYTPHLRGMGSSYPRPAGYARLLQVEPFLPGPGGTIEYFPMCRIGRFPIRLIHQPVELSCRGDCIWSRHCNAAFSPHHRVCQ